MLKMDTKNTFATGSIIRIKLENFVTYDSLEFQPGPNLNVIIGPNGTGKSTIVCAICLGMAGKPSVLGRAASLADYIKYGRNRALIEIELNNTNGRNYVVRRDIFRDNRSEWFINAKSVKLKEVEDLVHELNIQVSNLCQFLPQEKVSEFARMNQQQLLENTEKAVGGLELYEKHQRLKDERETSKNYEKELLTYQEALKKEEAINARLENQVKSFLEKQKNEQEILWLKRKRAWMSHDEKKEEFNALKKEKNKYDKELEALDRKFEPMQENKNNIEKNLSKNKTELTNKATSIKELLNKLNSSQKRRDEFSDRAQEIKQEYLTKENEFKHRKIKIDDVRLNIETLREELDGSKDELIKINEREKELIVRETLYNQEMQVHNNKEYELKQTGYRLKQRRDEIARQIENMKNVREDKLKKLRQHMEDSYKALQWLEKNREIFEDAVYEPMLLLINLKDRDSARYVESLIQKRDLHSLFLFESSNDMHKFMIEMRDRQHLVVHAALVPKQTVDSFHPPYGIQELKKYGFKSYVREVIDAPDALIRYLCLYSHIHRVPIGDDYTHKNISQIIPNIPQLTRIYTSTHQYSFTKSRYSNKTSSSSSEVGTAFWLSMSVDQADMNSVVESEKEIRKKLQDCERDYQQCVEEKRKCEWQHEDMKQERKNLREKRGCIQSLESKIKQKQMLLQSLEKQKTNLVDEAKNKFMQLTEIFNSRALIYKNYVEQMTKLIGHNKDKVILAYTVLKLQTELNQIQVDMQNYEARKKNMLSEIENSKLRLQRVQDEAKLFLQNALEICGIRSEKEITQAMRNKFEQLPSTMDEIQSAINEIEVRAQCTFDVDKQVIDDFNERKKKIEHLRTEVNKREALLMHQKKNYEELKNNWFTEVENMVSVISVKFSELFRIIKCLGEVVLARPDNPEDYDKYGVRINVSFRSDERMQELTAWQQSGGEKSVSTMLYMIALQEQVKCPFRVVDEINQGMDPANERKVFEIIVQNSSAKACAQYFLLTPKLLSDLSFDDKTKVICVYNGPQNLPHLKYNLKYFIEKRKNLPHDDAQSI